MPLLAAVRDLFSRLNVYARLTTLEYRMSLTDAALADLDFATNEVAAELQELAAIIAASDSEVAARITTAANRLRGLAADPENPVPAPENPPNGSNSEPEPLPETQTGPDVAEQPPA